jgi:hypothetical protein
MRAEEAKHLFESASEHYFGATTLNFLQLGIKLI